MTKAERIKKHFNIKDEPGPLGFSLTIRQRMLESHFNNDPVVCTSVVLERMFRQMISAFADDFLFLAKLEKENEQPSFDYKKMLQNYIRHVEICIRECEGVDANFADNSPYSKEKGASFFSKEEWNELVRLNKEVERDGE